MFYYQRSCISGTIPAKVILQLTTSFREGGLRNRTGTFCYKDHLHKCDVPVLALAADEDLICPPEAVYGTSKITLILSIMSIWWALTRKSFFLKWNLQKLSNFFPRTCVLTRSLGSLEAHIMVTMIWLEDVWYVCFLNYLFLLRTAYKTGAIAVGNRLFLLTPLKWWNTLQIWRRSSMYKNILRDCFIWFLHGSGKWDFSFLGEHNGNIFHTFCMWDLWVRCKTLTILTLCLRKTHFPFPSINPVNNFVGIFISTGKSHQEYPSKFNFPPNLTTPSSLCFYTSLLQPNTETL